MTRTPSQEGIFAPGGGSKAGGFRPGGSLGSRGSSPASRSFPIFRQDVSTIAFQRMCLQGTREKKLVCKLKGGSVVSNYLRIQALHLESVVEPCFMWGITSLLLTTVETLLTDMLISKSKHSDGLLLANREALATPPAQPSEPEAKSSGEASRKPAAEASRAAPKADEEQRAVALMVEYMTLKSTKEVQEVISQELQPSRIEYGSIVAGWISAACEKKEVDRELFKVGTLHQIYAIMPGSPSIRQDKLAKSDSLISFSYGRIKVLMTLAVSFFKPSSYRSSLMELQWLRIQK